MIDEYVDHDSGSKNAANRPRFKAMLDRIFEQGDVDAVSTRSTASLETLPTTSPCGRRSAARTYR